MAEINTEGKFLVSADGAKLNGKDITLPARAEIKVTYSWPRVRRPRPRELSTNN